MATKRNSPMDDLTPVGNLDGMELDGQGGYTVTNWMNAGIFT